MDNRDCNSYADYFALMSMTDVSTLIFRLVLHGYAGLAKIIIGQMNYDHESIYKVFSDSEFYTKEELKRLDIFFKEMFHIKKKGD